MNLKHIPMLVGGLLAVGLANAGETMQAPNYYQCTGRGANLTLSIGSKAEVGIMPAQTLLSLTLGKKSYSFTEDQITLESTLVGQLWEVPLQQVPDAYIKYASLIIPEINLGRQPQDFRSQLVLTKLASSLSGKPQVGVNNPSNFIDLACQAMMVYY